MADVLGAKGVERMFLAARLGVASILIAGLGGIAAAPAVSASGHPPQRSVRIESGSFVDTETCGFPITFVFQSRIVDTRYFDSSGTLVRERFFVKQPSLDTAKGTTLHENDVFSDVIDYRTGKEWLVGATFKITAPGHGHVLLQAGKAVFDFDGNLLFVAGPHPLLEAGDPLAAFCNAFG
jgi:hypothetical protein